MKPPFAARINMLAAAGRATLIRVPSLFTEDQGPAVSGIWSVVVPKLMDLVREEQGMDKGYAGAGLYYHEVQRRPDGSNENITTAVAHLSQILFTAMFVACDLDILFEDLEQLGSEFSSDDALKMFERMPVIYARRLDEDIEMYLQYVERDRLFGKDNTLAMASGRLLEGMREGFNANVDVSSSHCLRLHINDAAAKRLMQQFRASLERPYWRDTDWIERA